MKISVIEAGGVRIAVCESDEAVIFDGQSALDFIVGIGYEHDCYCLVIDKTAIVEGFFDLSSGIAGEVAQKFVNYGFRVAIVGDFSAYSSQALRAYIYESNNGRHLCFVGDVDAAIARLSGLVASQG